MDGRGVLLHWEPATGRGWLHCTACEVQAYAGWQYTVASVRPGAALTESMAVDFDLELGRLSTGQTVYMAYNVRLAGTP